MTSVATAVTGSITLLYFGFSHFPVPHVSVPHSCFLVAGPCPRLCFLGTQLTRSPEALCEKLSVALGRPLWPLLQSPVLQGLGG